MPASLPESSTAQNAANPSVGRFVIFDLLSGPKASPFDVRKITFSAGGLPSYASDAANQKSSTGGLSTGIGFGTGDDVPSVIGLTAPASIKKAGFNDDYTPGLTKPDGTASANSTLMYIGGGKSGPISTATKGIPFPTTPYVAGFGIGGAGNGGSRDAGAGPAFTGFTLKMVTAAAGVANGAAVEAGWLNRSNIALLAGQSVFGSNAAASAVPA